jgi:hypothetical protein
MRRVIINDVDLMTENEENELYSILQKLNVEFHVHDIEKYCEWRWNK